MTPRLRGFLWSRRSRRIVIAAGITVVAIASLTVAAAGALARERPAWWRTIRPDDRQTIAAAERVERVFTAELTRVRPTDPAIQWPGPGPWRSEPWVLELDAMDVNAWLCTRLPGWLAAQGDADAWPGGLGEVQVDFASPSVRIGATIRVSGRDQVISATLAPQVRHDAARPGDDGALWAPASWVHVGRLSIPASWVIDADAAHRGYVPKELRALPETTAMFKALAGQGPLRDDASIRVGDGRRVRVLAIEPRGKTIRLTCRTELE